MSVSASVEPQEVHSFVLVRTAVDKVPEPGEVTVTVPLTICEAVAVSTKVSETMTVEMVGDSG